VQGVLAVSTEQKIDWSAQITERRLEEAETLAAEGTLTTQQSDMLAQQVDDSTQNFDTQVSRLASASGNDEAIADAQSNLQASLAAHAHVLETLSVQLPDTQKAITPLLAAVKNKAAGSGIAAARIQNAQEQAQKHAATKAAVSMRKQRALEQLSETRALAAKAKEQLGTSTISIVDNEASSTEEVITDAGKKEQAGDLDSALATYQQALQISTEEKAGINAQIHLRPRTQLGGLVNLTETDEEATSTATTTEKTDTTTATTSPKQEQ
jgi:hypothetical protein